MPVQVPQIQPPRPPLGEQLIPSALAALLYGYKMSQGAAAQEAQREQYEKVQSNQNASALDDLMNRASRYNEAIPSASSALTTETKPSVADVGAAPSGALPGLSAAPAGSTVLPQPNSAAPPEARTASFSAPQYPELSSVLNKASDIQSDITKEPIPRGFTGGPYANMAQNFMTQHPEITPGLGKSPMQLESGYDASGNKQVTPVNKFSTTPTQVSSATGEATRAAGIKSATQAVTYKLIQTQDAKGNSIQTFVPQVVGTVYAGNPTSNRLRFMSTTPGLAFDRNNNQWFIDKRPVNSDEAEQYSLDYLASKPTPRAVNMKQLAGGTVLPLISDAKDALATVRNELGPVNGRFDELYAGTIGASNPNYIALKSALYWMSTAAGTMHYGASTPVEVMKALKDLNDPGKSTPDNLESSMNVLENYARREAAKKFTMEGVKSPPATPKLEGYDPLGILPKGK